MYTLARGPSKIAASSRRGPPRQVDLKSYENRDKNSKNGSISDNPLEMSNPKPTFQQRRSIPKKMTPPPPSMMPSSSSPSSSSSNHHHLDPILQENHMEMRKLLSCQWKKVEDGLRKSSDQEDPAWKIYREKEPDKSLEDFQAFDLDTLWYRYSKTARGKAS